MALKIEAVLFDMIGTTVMEKVPGTVTLCMQYALEGNGVVVDKSVIDQHRGKDKIEMINKILESIGQPVQKAKPIFGHFKRTINECLGNFEPMPGVEEVFETLGSHGIKVGIGTGLPPDVFYNLLHHLRWRKESFDYTGVAADLGKTRPHPAMIFDMINALQLQGGTAFLKVGDTVADIQEGKNAQVKTAVVLSGTQPEDKLTNAHPDFILYEIKEVLALVE